MTALVYDFNIVVAMNECIFNNNNYSYIVKTAKLIPYNQQSDIIEKSIGNRDFLVTFQFHSMLFYPYQSYR